MTARGNGSSDIDFVEHCEAAVAKNREGLDWLAHRMREVRLAILQMMMNHNRLDLTPETELQRLRNSAGRQRKATTMSKIEGLAARHARSVTLTPMEEWDRAVAERMDRDRCSRDCAVDRLLATAAGSSLWCRACTWDAAQPKVVIEKGREVRSGNWGSSGFATLRRVPRRP